MKKIQSLLGSKYAEYTQLQNITDQMKSSSIIKSMLSVLGRIFKYAARYSCLSLLPAILIYQGHYLPNSIIVSSLILMLILMLFLGLFYQLQDRLLYHPDMPENSRLYVPLPAYTEYEIVDLKTTDGENLHGFFLYQPQRKNDVPTVIYFHGNAGNAGSPCVLPLYKMCEVNILVVDYRGYGKSSGFPSEEGLYLDGEACIKYLQSREDINPNKIILFGHSLGGAVAIHLASKMQSSDYRIAGLIVENTFTSIPAAANHIFGGLIASISKLPLACYKNKFLSINKIKDVTMPILFICGEKDEILNPKMSKILQNASDNTRTVLLRVPNGAHNDTWCVSIMYHRCVTMFLNKVFCEDLQESGNADHSMESGLNFTWGAEILSD